MSPEIVHPVDFVDVHEPAVFGPPVAVTKAEARYRVMRLPPSLTGAFQEMAAEAAPATAVTDVGGPGGLAGAAVGVPTTSSAPEAPESFLAKTRTL
jgi:hypothetical protein